METEKSKMKKRLNLMIWQLYQTILGDRHQKYPPLCEMSLLGRKNKGKVAPEGCFSVYVGSERKRFVIKAKYANHPLFQTLLEESKLEYGYNSGGPILIPCKVDQFCEVLEEMKRKRLTSSVGICCVSCGHFKPAFQPSRRMGKDCQSYGLLNTPS